MASIDDETRPSDGLVTWLGTVAGLVEGAGTAASATAERVAALEAQLGLVLDETHRRLLLAQDGWEPTGRTKELAGPVRIASVEWLGRAPRTFSGPALEPLTGAATARELLDAGVTLGDCLAVAVDPFYGATYLVPVRDGRAGPEVVTLAGWAEEDTFIGEIYPSFADFLGAMTEQVATHARRFVARETKEARAREVWHAEPAVVVRGLPDTRQQLASGLLTLMGRLARSQPDAPWEIATRRWDGSPAGLERVMSEATRVLPDGAHVLFLTASTRLADGRAWQVSVTRSWPAAAKDHVLLLLRSAGDGGPPAPGEVDALVVEAAEILSPSSVTASSTAANRTATERGIPQPTGYRVWLREDQLGTAAADVDGGEIGRRAVGGGVMLSSPDGWPPDQVVVEASALVARLREARPEPDDGAPTSDEGGGRLSRWFRGRRR
ncbi:hypothetical protein C8046_16835 [Serinibacter arcticus]|uniref:Knr4/Smi1-like domain-containing protein n=1 Tax=Serinibacter arcticus TaxID=1655435 RepID=A0A2U1ZYM0_9MICO|nr:SMI1/KNR4 family protein [Serinibacter arcticus]PWD52064.1 hypothetical protein C8046_16835 [Serinibacter arcticus]